MIIHVSELEIIEIFSYLFIFYFLYLGTFIIFGIANIRELRTHSFDIGIFFNAAKRGQIS